MKTYAESRGKEPFDWNKALRQCLSEEIEKGSEEHNEMMTLSQNWVTCACGNQCDIIPRTDEGSPFDDELDLLGVDFARHVLYFRIKNAIETLEQIEKRSAELIKNIQNGNVL